MLTNELNDRGRMISVLSLTPEEGQPIDDAIRDHALSDTGLLRNIIPVDLGEDP
jgi:hypothetical protein